MLICKIVVDNGPVYTFANILQIILQIQNILLRTENCYLRNWVWKPQKTAETTCKQLSFRSSEHTGAREPTFYNGCRKPQYCECENLWQKQNTRDCVEFLKIELQIAEIGWVHTVNFHYIMLVMI